MKAFILILFFSITVAAQTCPCPSPSPTPTPIVTPTPTVTPTPVPTPTPLPSPTPSTGNVFYVAPNGSAAGSGSQSAPWDLTTALAHPSAIKPGDMICLNDGIYGAGNKTQFFSRLTGSPNAPIIVKQCGARATVDGSIRADGAHTWFWGFEITNSSTVRDATDINKDRPPGLLLYGNGNKAINLIINNTGRAGVGFWSNVTSGYSGEIYGTIFWGNGIYDPSGQSYCGCRGDAVYANLGDRNPSAQIRETISFRNFNLGVKVYTESISRFVNNFLLSGNVVFDHTNYDLTVEHTSVPISGLRVLNNFSYQRRERTNNHLKFGRPNINSADALIRDNYFAPAKISTGVYVNRWNDLRFINNTIVSSNVFTRFEPSTTPVAQLWDANNYQGGSSLPFRKVSTAYSFSGWKTATGFDANSTYSATLPSTTQVFVRPNEYEVGRGHVIVYNWSRTNSVEVDLSSVLAIGHAFEVRDAQNYFGPAVVSGVFDGSPVVIPMTGTAVAPIVGNRHVNNIHTEIEFGVFVVISR